MDRLVARAQMLMYYEGLSWEDTSSDRPCPVCGEVSRRKYKVVVPRSTQQKGKYNSRG